jgi:PST family polysaccharide transporter
MAVLAAAVLCGGLQVGSIAIIARLIPPADYGIYAMALPGVMIGIALSNFGLPQAIVQRRTITHLHVSALFWLNLGFALPITVIMIALAGPMAAWYGEPRVLPVLQLVSLSLLFSAMAGQYVAILRRRMQIRQTEMMTLGAEILGLAVAVVGALNGLSYWALVLQQIATPMLKTLFIVLHCRWLPSGPQHVRFADALGSLKFGGYLAGAAILTRLTGYVGVLVAGGLFPAAAVGLFYRARNIATLGPQRVTDPLTSVFTATLSRMQDDTAGFTAMFVRLVSRSNLIIMPISLFVALGSGPLVAILMGPAWSEAAPLLFWLSLTALRQGASTGLRTVLIAWGSSKALFVFGIARLVLLTGSMAIAGRLGGLEAMVMGYAFCELFLTLPLMLAMAVRATPLTTGLFMRASGADMLLAFALAGLLQVTLVPVMADSPALVQLAGLGAAIGLACAVRVAVSPGLRADVLRVVLSMVRKVR